MIKTEVIMGEGTIQTSMATYSDTDTKKEIFPAIVFKELPYLGLKSGDKIPDHVKAKPFQKIIIQIRNKESLDILKLAIDKCEDFFTKLDSCSHTRGEK